MTPLMIAMGLAALALAMMCQLDTTYIPHPQDSKLAMDLGTAPVTVTGVGAVLDLGAGFTPGNVGMPAAIVIQTTAIKTSAGNESYSFQPMESADGITYTAAGLPVVITAKGGRSAPMYLSQRYVRLDPTIGGTAPTITYQSWLNPLAAGSL